MNLRKKKKDARKLKQKRKHTHKHTHTHTRFLCILYNLYYYLPLIFDLPHVTTFLMCSKKFKREQGKLQFCLFQWGASAQSVFRSLIFCQLARKKKKKDRQRGERVQISSLMHYLVKMVSAEGTCCLLFGERNCKCLPDPADLSMFKKTFPEFSWTGPRCPRAIYTVPLWNIFKGKYSAL